MNRFDRIGVIKETREENKTVNIKLSTPQLHQAEQQRGDQADAQPDMHGDQAEQMEQPSPSHSFSTQHHKTIQPLTIMRAVRRCVSVQPNITSTTLLTPKKLGTLQMDRGQAEQPENEEACPGQQQHQQENLPSPSAD